MNKEFTVKRGIPHIPLHFHEQGDLKNHKSLLRSYNRTLKISHLYTGYQSPVVKMFVQTTLTTIYRTVKDRRQIFWDDIDLTS